MKSKLTPLLHNELLDISDVQVLDESDEKCLSEINQVITKYSKNKKFGVSLLHKHFDINENELLVETINTEDRILTTKPILISEAKKRTLIQTVWSFSNDKSFERGCQSFCPTDSSGRHKGYKDHDPD